MPCSNHRKYELKTILLTVLFIFLPTSLLAYQNEPDGFRGIKWKTNISELTNMKLMEDDRNTKFYVRKNDKMKIGEAEIERVYYRFYKGRFSGVIIIFTSSSNLSKIRETFFQLYGSGINPNQLMENYYWIGSNVNIALEYKEIIGKGTIVYQYNPITTEEKADSKTKAKEGAGDL